MKYPYVRMSMTVGQKASVSLLVSTLLAAGFAALAYSGLFSVIETSFFDERVRRSVEISVDGLTESATAYHERNTERFAELLENDYVRRSFLPNQSAQDIFDRTKTFGLLAEETAGLQGVRFLDQDGKRIHFSTFSGDVIRSESIRVVYRNYGDEGDEPIDILSVPEGSAGSVSTLPTRRSFAYGFPFVDGFGVYRGSAIFYVAFSGLLERLVQDGRIPLGDDVVAVGTQGILIGAPVWGGQDLISRVAEIWSAGPNAEPVPVGASEASGSFILFSRRGDSGLVGQLVPASWFEMPESFRWLLLTTFFITVYLALFLILNLRQDRFAMLAGRIKRFQIELLEEYLERKGDMDIARWRGELEARRGETRDRIRKSAGRIAKKRSADVDALIDKSWDEIIAVMTARGERPGGLDLAKIEALLKEALSKGSFVIGSAAVHAPAARASRIVPVKPGPASIAGAAEAVEDVEDVEELGELEDAGEAGDVEDVEELGELEDAGEVEDAEEAEELGELEDAGEAGDVEEAEELGELEDAGEAGDVEDVEELGELEDAGEVEDVEDVEDVEELGELEDAGEAGDAEEAGELTEFEDAEDMEELVEPAGLTVAGPETGAVATELLEAEGVEELEEFEELEEVEEVGELDEIRMGAALATAPRAGAPDSTPVEKPKEAEELEELEELDELEEVAEFVGSDDDEPVEWGSLSAEALALATDDDDDYPIIPESLGLELVEETDLADIIGYLEAGIYQEEPDYQESITPEADSTGDDEIFTELVFASPLEDIAETVQELHESAQADEVDLEFGSPGEIMEDLLEEVEFDLFLSTLDLSALEGYSDEDGFLELDDASFKAEIPSPIPEPEYSEETASDEISMLTDEQRERMEELQVVTLDDSEILDVEPLEGSGYRQIISAFSHRSPDWSSGRLEELPAVSESEPSDAVPLEDEASSDMIVLVDGIYTVNRSGFQGTPAEDQTLKALADSVLQHRGA